MAPKLSESVERLRAAGNQSFRNGQFAEAAALYSRALRVMQEQGTSLAARSPRRGFSPVSRPQRPSPRSVPAFLPFPAGRPSRRALPPRFPHGPRCGRPTRNFLSPFFTS